LQVVTIVGLDAVSVVAQILLVRMEQEVLHHVRHLHFLKHGKKDAFGHAPNPTSTIQGTVCTGLTGTLLAKKGQRFHKCVKFKPLDVFIARIKLVKSLKWRH